MAYSDSTLLVVLVRLRQTRIQESDMSATALQQMKNMKASNCGCDISRFKCDAPIPFLSVQLAIASGPGCSSLVEGLTASCSKKLEKHMIHLLVLSKRDHSGQRLFVSVLPAGRDIPPESGVGLGGTLSAGLNFIDTRPPTLEPGLLQTLGILNNLIQKIQMHDF